MAKDKTYYTHLGTPIDDLLLAGDGQKIFLISFADGSKTKYARDEWHHDDAPFRAATDQLQAYFAGELQSFDFDMELRGTDFQVSVWNALLTIPYGETISYGELARRIGRPSASRAVGAANGANPIPVVVPCHRVIGKDNSLTGYASGIDVKRWLLEHEGVLARQTSLF